MNALPNCYDDDDDGTAKAIIVRFAPQNRFATT